MSGSEALAGERRGRARVADHDVELLSVPFCASWLNRMEAQFQALRYFTLDGTDTIPMSSRPA